MASSSAALPLPGWAHSTALYQLTRVVSIDDWENQPELAAPDYVDPYPVNSVLPMADCWNMTASGFMEVRTSLRIIMGKDNSNRASNQRPSLATQPVTHAKAEWMPWTTFVQQH
ncbi:hypothetical protein K469DRAFT_686655 [Zopfia rhizophila CBS 207.26]|uniref:Uncharacterized protein n=1 Tax=Zopfia rhizophila CBS 207.26 TaxID=1314779 RepID=A0A6A6ESX2_9PEZI|nr:hypothetical protein K469DRAFT_686655 [Zopfia rhizophila CBS 207.26]